MTGPDILARLRESDGGYFMRQMFTEAADEIERLRKERDEVVLARGMEWMDHAIQVKRERNAAQRELCTLLAGERQRLGVRCTPEEIAASRGWDCFPPDEVQDDVTVAVRRAYGDPLNSKETTP